MDKSREIVFHLARRLLWAKRELRDFDKREYPHLHMKHALWMVSNEAQNCYRVGKMVLDDIEEGACLDEIERANTRGKQS